jgi:hypothetical protein
MLGAAPASEPDPRPGTALGVSSVHSHCNTLSWPSQRRWSADDADPRRDCLSGAEAMKQRQTAERPREQVNAWTRGQVSVCAGCGG